LATNLKLDVSEDILELHFTSAKVTARDDVDASVEFDPQNHAAIVSLSDASGAHSIVTLNLHLTVSDVMPCCRIVNAAKQRFTSLTVFFCNMPLIFFLLYTLSLRPYLFL
jgi:hypothetical protein